MSLPEFAAKFPQVFELSPGNRKSLFKPWARITKFISFVSTIDWRGQQDMFFKFLITKFFADPHNTFT